VAKLPDELHRSDVDAQLQRSGGDESFQGPRTEAQLHALATFPRQAAVMSSHLVLAEPLPQLVGDPFGHPPSVDEHEGRAVALHMLGDAVEDLPHLFGRGHRRELVVGELEGEVESALVPDVDDRAARGAVRVRPAGTGADEQPGDGVDRPLGGGEPDPLRRGGGDVMEPLEGEGEVRSSFVPRHRVDLVEDDCLYPPEHRARALRGDQQV